MEEARIPWKPETAYDDWNSITRVLYEKIVVESLRNAIPASEMGRFALPAYGLR